MPNAAQYSKFKRDVKLRNSKIEAMYRENKPFYQIADELQLPSLVVEKVVETLQEKDKQLATQSTKQNCEVAFLPVTQQIKQPTEKPKTFSMSFMQGSDPLRQTRINSIINGRKGKL